MARKKTQVVSPDWPALSVESWPLGRITPYPKNPRSHPEEQVAALALLMTEHGVDQPIVVDEDGVILKGHGRLLAAYKAGFKVFPVAKHIGLAEAQKQKIRLADNQMSLLSEWDIGLRDEALAFLKLQGIDMSAYGFGELSLGGLGEIGQTISLSDRFGIVPFSVFNAREGVWQDRKRAWLSLGIQSEVGRGENLIGRSPQELFCYYTGIPYGEAREIVTEAMEEQGEAFDLAALVKAHGGKVTSSDFSGVDMSPTIKRLKPSADQTYKRAKARAKNGK